MSTDTAQSVAAQREHPATSIYITVAVALIILTGLELTVFYVQLLQPVLVPLLIILAIAKFSLVAMFYMHLHYDSKVFTTFFVFPLLLAVTLAISLLLLFEYLLHHLSFILS